MCGIVGAFSFSNNGFSVDERYLKRMSDKIAHRGPDGDGFWVSQDKRVGFAHRRLSIIDLSPAAAQPMSNEDGSLWITFNGEIYNHADIRAELEKIGGHKWRTNHSDTEVVLHAFEQWGIDCIHKFRGMFAIGLWDSRKEELWLVRDRIGVKPLYYSFHDGRVVFASEIKALLEDPGQKRVINEEALFHFLSFLTAPAPQTLFSGINKLPCATWLRISRDGSSRENRYWDPFDAATDFTGVPEEDVSARLIAELRTSVKLRKVSDVPVGVFLSGGIDSSTNAVLFSEGESRPVKTFSIGYKGDYASYRNELEYARKVADMVKADHHELLLSQEDMLEFLPRMVFLQDEPIADPVCVPVYYVSKLARDNGVIVCQVGEGADELFCGYPGWRDAIKFQNYGQFPIPNMFKRGALAALGALGQDSKARHEWLRRNIAGQPIFWGGAEAFTHSHKLRLLSGRLRKKFENFTSWEAIKPIHERFLSKAHNPTPLKWMTYLDLNLRLPELLLMRVDKMNMGVSLEGRVPFLDYKFVEFAMGVPDTLKLRDGTLKYILKRAVADVLPAEIINRPKQGFGMPVYEWFFDRLGETAQQKVGAFLDKTDFFDRDEVNALMAGGHGPQAWYILNFAMWWEEYFGN